MLIKVLYIMLVLIVWSQVIEIIRIRKIISVGLNQTEVDNYLNVSLKLIKSLGILSTLMCIIGIVLAFIR